MRVGNRGCFPDNWRPGSLFDQPICPFIPHASCTTGCWGEIKGRSQPLFNKFPQNFRLKVYHWVQLCKNIKSDTVTQMPTRLRQQLTYSEPVIKIPSMQYQQEIKWNLCTRWEGGCHMGHMLCCYALLALSGYAVDPSHPSRPALVL